MKYTKKYKIRGIESEIIAEYDEDGMILVSQEWFEAMIRHIEKVYEMGKEDCKREILEDDGK